LSYPAAHEDAGEDAIVHLDVVAVVGVQAPNQVDQDRREAEGQQGFDKIRMTNTGKGSLEVEKDQRPGAGATDGSLKGSVI